MSVCSCVMRLSRARLNNLWWERRLGISTRGIVDVDNPDSHHYATMDYYRIERILNYLNPKRSDVFVDIGSGKGRVLCLAARYDMAQVVGVDLSPALCREASANVARMRGRRAPVEVKAIPAQEFDYSAATVLFMFNPFGAATLEEVLTKAGRDSAGRDVRIAYGYPTHDAVFKTQTWLQRYEYWDDSSKEGLGESVSFYRSV